MGKSSVIGVVADHYSTLRDVQTHDVRATDWISQLVIPTLVSVALTAWPLHVTMHDFGQVIAGLSILGGFMFGLVTYVFQLRVSVASDPRIESSGRPVLQLLDELFANLSYAVLVCVGGALFSVVCATVLPSPVPKGGGWRIAALATSGVVFFLLMHAALVVAMCLKRIRSAYAALRV